MFNLAYSKKSFFIFWANVFFFNGQREVYCSKQGMFLHYRLYRHRSNIFVALFLLLLVTNCNWICHCLTINASRSPPTFLWNASCRNLNLWSHSVENDGFQIKFFLNFFHLFCKQWAINRQIFSSTWLNQF